MTTAVPASDPSSGPADPLAGLEFPPGEPRPLRTMAAKITDAANLAADAARKGSGTSAATVGTAWIGGKADRTDKALKHLSGVVKTFVGGADVASSALLKCAKEWEDARELWHKAQALARKVMNEEQGKPPKPGSGPTTAGGPPPDHHHHHHHHHPDSGSGVTSVGGPPATGGGSGTTSVGAPNPDPTANADRAAQNPDFAKARALAEKAIEDFNRATTTTVARLAELPGPVSASLVLEELKIDSATSDVTDPTTYATLRTELQGLATATQDPTSIEQFEQTLAALTPAERRQLVDDLVGNPVLTNLANDVAADPDGLGLTNQISLYNLLLQNASPTAVKSIMTTFPGADPSLAGVTAWDGGTAAKPTPPVATTYAPVQGTLLGPGGTVDPDDVSQGEVGDCIFLSSLIALATEDPSWVADHIHDNGNGTTTVTLFQNGQPVQVTVTNTMPVAGTDYGGAYDGNTSAPVQYWGQMYEKAFAQLEGGYGVIDQGGTTGALGLDALTGQTASTAPPGSVTSAQLQGLLAGGHHVIVATTSNTGYTSGSDLNGTLVENHEYMVKSVNADGTVTLRNPWNPNDCPTMTWAQMQSQLGQVAWT